MARIVVLGGTGYTGANIVRTAAARGHDVTSFSRSVPENPIPGVRYETGSLTEQVDRARAVAGADAVVATLAPRGEMAGELPGIYAELGALAAAEGARFGVIGGFSALRPTAGAPRIAYGSHIPEQFAVEARTMANVLDTLLESAPESLDWFYASPAAGYGSYAPGEDTGSYRLGSDTVLVDDDGKSAISGADFATAIVDEIETRAHHCTQFAIAY